MWLVSLLLVVIVVLLWMLYNTVDSFNEDLKQLRLLVGHIERFIAEDKDAEIMNRQKVSVAHASIVSINSDNKTALMTLPKIGSATAQKIIDNRPYSALSQLKEKASLGEELFALIEARVSL